jgi:ATP-binding cassette, subfamily C (CFTR/MRP), member 1
VKGLLTKAAVTPGLLGPLLTIAIFAIQTSSQHSHGLSTVKAFTSIAIISLVTTPAQALLGALPTITAASGCFDRIQAFLQAPTWKDERLKPATLPINSEEEGSIELQRLQSRLSNSPAVVVHRACIKPANESPMALQDVSFQVANGSLTMIIGSVGSGKSTLLKGILGELKCDTGTIQVASEKMAYCRQTSWLPNKTLREIVCGDRNTAEIDHDFYDTVIQACALEEDILQLPASHDTLIGSRGVTLSGGQKQRLVRPGSFDRAFDYYQKYTYHLSGLG